MSDCCSQGIKPCECKGKRYQWVGNQVFTLGWEKSWEKSEISERDLKKPFGGFKTINSTLCLNAKSPTRDILSGYSHKGQAGTFQIFSLWRWGGNGLAICQNPHYFSLTTPEKDRVCHPAICNRYPASPWRKIALATGHGKWGSHGRGCTGEFLKKKMFSNCFFCQCNVVGMVCYMNTHQEMI